MTTYHQVWGNFAKDDRDREYPTTVSVFRKDQLMGDGHTRQVDFEREFATSEGEDFVLLREFEVDVTTLRELSDEELEQHITRGLFNSFMEGWWKSTKEPL